MTQFLFRRGVHTIVDYFKKSNIILLEGSNFINENRKLVI